MANHIDVYNIVEVKDGVYITSDEEGQIRLTSDINEADKFKLPTKTFSIEKVDFHSSMQQMIADDWFGTIRQLTITYNIE